MNNPNISSNRPLPPIPSSIMMTSGGLGGHHLHQKSPSAASSTSTRTTTSGGGGSYPRRRISPSITVCGESNGGSRRNSPATIKAGSSTGGGNTAAGSCSSSNADPSSPQKSIFEGATKYDILNYLEDARERGLTDCDLDDIEDDQEDAIEADPPMEPLVIGTHKLSNSSNSRYWK